MRYLGKSLILGDSAANPNHYRFVDLQNWGDETLWRAKHLSGITIPWLFENI
jgi:hypothetical protein